MSAVDGRGGETGEPPWELPRFRIKFCSMKRELIFFFAFQSIANYNKIVNLLLGFLLLLHAEKAQRESSKAADGINTGGIRRK